MDGELESEPTDLHPLFYGLSSLTVVEESDFDRLEHLCCGCHEAEKCAKGSRPEANPVWAYGEVLLAPFASLLRSQCEGMNSTCQAGTFVDLGSGAGRAVLAAALIGGFSSCRGIEALETLHREAEGALMRCGADSRLSAQMSRVTFEHADLTEVSWWDDTSVAFCNCVTWPEPLIDAVGDGAKKLRAGACLMLVRRQLSNTDTASFFHVSKSSCDMTWAASVPIWIYKRRD